VSPMVHRSALLRSTVFVLSCLVSDLMMVSSNWLELLIIDTYCCCSNVREVSLNKRPMPRTYTQTNTETKQNMSLRGIDRSGEGQWEDKHE